MKEFLAGMWERITAADKRKPKFWIIVGVICLALALIIAILLLVKGPEAPPVQYNLTINSTPGGSVTEPHEGECGPYEQGARVNITAAPDSGYDFEKWTGDVEEVGDVSSASTNITMKGNYIITANFVIKAEPQPEKEYTLTVSSDIGGEVTKPGEGSFTYPEGTEVSLLADPDSCYTFVEWTGDVEEVGDADDASTKITINGNYTITANFHRRSGGGGGGGGGGTHVVKYQLSIDSTDCGNVTIPGEGSFTYFEGEVVSLLADADSCYHFVNWTGDTGNIANIYDFSTTIKMEDDYSIVANFAEDVVVRYNLTITSTSGGSVTTPGEGEFGPYLEGTEVDLVATSCSGYHFVNWTGDTDTIDNANSTSTSITVEDDYSITANFAENVPEEYTLTVTSTSGGTVTNPGEGSFTYLAGTEVTLLVDADSCHHFVNWTGDTGNIANIYDFSTTIKMEDDYSIVANFAEDVVVRYNLTITSTSGGSVTTPGEGEFGPYSESTTVSLVATPCSGYHFVSWTGDTGTIPDIGDPSTTIIMDGDYSIVANFAQGVVEPEFNSCPGDKSLIRLMNLNRGGSWNVSVEAEPGDTIGFDVYYHNCVEGSVAENTKIKITFPQEPLSEIVPTGHLWADNAQEISDSGIIDVSDEPQKLKFDTTGAIAWWYPNQTGSDPIELTPTITDTAIEVSIGDIGGGWEYQGHVVFRAKLRD